MGLIERLAFWRPRNVVKPPDPARSGPNVYWTGDESAFLSGDSEDGKTFLRDGVLITPDIALQVSAVWACIDVQARAIASSDWLVAEQETPKRRKVLYGDELTYILNTRPNPDMTAVAFRRAMVMAMLSWGNGYANIVRNAGGRVASLYPIHPERVRPFRVENDPNLSFEVTNDDGSTTIVPEREMFRVRGPSILGLLGVNRIGQAAATIALARSTQEFSQAFFSNGGRPGGVVTHSGLIDDPTFARLSKQWNARHGGPRKAFATAFLDQGLSYTPLPNDGDKAQMIEARNADILDIARWWGLPPHKIQYLIDSSYNSVEQLGIEFVRDCLRPLAREFTQEADYKLFSARNSRRCTYIDLDWASEGDFKSRMEGFNIARNDGVLNANEIREELGWDHIGPDGDRYIVQGAMIDLSEVGLPYKQSAAPAKESAPDDEEDDTEEPDDAEDGEDSVMRAWAIASFDSCMKMRVSRKRDMLAKGIAEDEADSRIGSQVRAFSGANCLPLSKALSKRYGKDVSKHVVDCAEIAINANDPLIAVKTLFTLLGKSK